MQVTDYIVDFIIKKGITDVFGSPILLTRFTKGKRFMPMWYTMSRLRHLQPRHMLKYP